MDASFIYLSSAWDSVRSFSVSLMAAFTPPLRTMSHGQMNKYLITHSLHPFTSSCLCLSASFSCQSPDLSHLMVIHILDTRDSLKHLHTMFCKNSANSIFATLLSFNNDSWRETSSLKVLKSIWSIRFTGLLVSELGVKGVTATP